MTYREAEHFLFNQFNDFSKYGRSAYNPGLQNISELAQAFDNPQNKIKCIHVAGTNGKGSVCHLLCSILMEQGYSVGLYTSPHLIDFRERIQINGQFISKKFILHFIQQLRKKTLTNKPSFFEITTCLAWCYFAYSKVDYVVLETGLGGRLDSTNIVNPILSIITNIGLDHAEILGDTRQKIAVEKAGIIKNNRPCVIGETDATIQPVFSKYQKIAPLIYAQKCFKVELKSAKNNSDTFIASHKKSPKKIQLHSGLYGTYQTKNISTVLTATEVLKSLKIKISATAIKKGLAQVQKNCPLFGRWQVLNTAPYIITDVAHNSEGCKNVLKDVKNIPAKKKYVFMGTSADKDYMKMIAIFPKNIQFVFSKAKNPRALEPHILHEKALKLNRLSSYYQHISEAWKELSLKLTKDDAVIIIGSIFFVSEWLQIYDKRRF